MSCRRRPACKLWRYTGYLAPSCFRSRRAVSEMKPVEVDRARVGGSGTAIGVDDVAFDGIAGRSPARGQPDRIALQISADLRVDGVVGEDQVGLARRARPTEACPVAKRTVKITVRSRPCPRQELSAPAAERPDRRLRGRWRRPSANAVVACHARCVRYRANGPRRR